MRTVAALLTAIIIFCTMQAEAANIVPRQHRRFVPPINVPHRSENAPRKDYAPRQPARPTPRYTPSKPKPSRDNRGGRIKPFGRR